MIVCRACMAIGADLNNIDAIGLTHTFANLVGIPEPPSYGLPPHICKACTHLLHKFKRYRDKCRKSMQTLRKLYLNNQLTTDHMNSLETQGFLDLKPSGTKTVNFEPIKRRLMFSRILNVNIFGNCNDDIKNSNTNYSVEPSGLIVKLEKLDPETVDQITNTTLKCYYDEELDSEERLFDHHVTVKSESGASYPEPVTVATGRMKRKRKIDPANAVTIETNTEIEDIEKKDFVVVSTHTSFKQSKDNKERKTSVKVNRKVIKNITKKKTTKEKFDPKTEDLLKKNEKNFMILKRFYESFPCPRKSLTSKILRQIQYFDDAAKNYNIEVQYLTKEEQINDVEAMKEQFRHNNYQCSICNKGFSLGSAYKTHMLGHDSAAGDFACDICGLRYKNNRIRSHHVRAQHSYRFTCKTCGKILRNIKFARDHYKWHSDGGALKCEECDKRFKTTSNYYDHMRKFHKKNAEGCTLCGGSFTGETGLLMHMNKTHREAVRCNSCNLYFEDKTALIKHLNFNSTDGTCGSGNRVCTICGDEFTTEAAFTEHMRLHSINRFKCDKCTRAFPTCHRLKSHWTKEHSASGPCERAHRPDSSYIKQFVCEQCGKAVATAQGLSNHILLHTGEKPHPCPHCPKTFRLTLSLRTHLLTHTDERPYPCALCTAAFRQASHLQTHMRTHTLEKPFQCGYCQRRFAGKGNMQEHVRTIHEGLPPRRRKRDK